MEKEYDILISDTPNELIGAVERFLEQGWECQGGVSVTSYIQSDGMVNQIRFTYCQAIVREVKREKSNKSVGF